MNGQYPATRQSMRQERAAVPTVGPATAGDCEVDGLDLSMLRPFRAVARSARRTTEARAADEARKHCSPVAGRSTTTGEAAQ